MDFIVERNRIYKEDEFGNLIAEVTFPEIRKNVVEINHTFVHPDLSGNGIASSLIHTLALKLKQENKKAIPTCSYAIHWFNTHAEYEFLIEK